MCDDQNIYLTKRTWIGASLALAILASAQASAQDSVIDRKTPALSPQRTLPQQELVLSAIPENLRRIVFDAGSAKLPASAATQLDSLAALLTGGRRSIRIIGHAERGERPDAEAAHALGLARAQAVRQALIERGVMAEKLLPASRGYEAFIGEGRNPAALRFVSVEDRPE